MRGISGVVALVLGLVALFGAIGLQTVWAPPTTLTASTNSAAVDAPADAPLTVITGGINEVVDAGDEAVEYTLTGEGDYTVMLGQTRDVEAWVGEAAHNTVTGIETEGSDRQDPRVVVEHTEGEATVPDPAGSDLWVDLQEASGTIEQRWSVPSEGDWSLLVAADGTEPAPMDMTVTWTNTVGDSPWIVPLYIIGPLLILVGLALIAWALIRRRRGPGSGGQRPDQHPGQHPGQQGARGAGASGLPGGPGRPGEPGGSGGSHAVRSRVAGAAVAVLTLAGLAGAGPATADSGAPSADAPAGGGQEQYPIVTDSQLERILGKVAGIVEQGDEAQDAGALEYRVSGPALEMRRDNYENRGFSDDVQAAEPVAASPVVSVVAQADPSFPRSLLVVTEGEGNSNPQLLVLRQESARTNYNLISNTPMTPGAQFPSSDLSFTGGEVIASDDGSGLVMTPGQAISGVATYLTDPEADFADRMVENPAIDQIHEYQATLEEDTPDATIDIARKAIPGEATTMRLPDGSALVVSVIDNIVDVTPDEPGATVGFGGDLAAAKAGEDSNETTTGISMTYREVLAVRVPAEGATGEDAKVSLVGMTDELHAVSFE
ncbi:hypothetical protein [Citricoccus sp. I39-566]|uniref:hypothetical protein n=1 Tax=Citricoccus sp. I39-566 TaxID=3073268 RepID=UPI00286A165F|nr:hypothetical protein [Citricoccus sp. I39-566]WMY77001.1 hypothetical protein RE421_08920 [Citricoccus sp. I39-566]